MVELTTPTFLQNRSTDDFFKLARTILPTDIDVSEGSHSWNYLRAASLVAAEISEFILPEVINVLFPETSYGEFLDAHARSRGLTRRAPTAAYGEITVSAPHNTVIPAGSLFSTAAVNDAPSMDYMTLETAIVPETGSVKIPVECTQTGAIGNTGINTVVLVSSRLTGITAVTNEEEITGGTEEETDDSLIIRIIEYDRVQGESFTGNKSDYKRWAMSVPGVGDATVIAAEDDTGLVTIIITDMNGAPATEHLCSLVYNYIMQPDNEYQRLAPINAYLKVVPPTTIEIGIKAVIELEEEATLESVEAAFLAQVALYLPRALEEGEVKYTRIAAVLADVEGANDFKELLIGVKNGDTIEFGTVNIPIGIGQLPAVNKEDLSFTTGIVV